MKTTIHLLAAALLASASTHAQITYIDASVVTGGNTFRTSDPTNTTWLNTTQDSAVANNTQWVVRYGENFGINDSSLQSIASSSANFPEITTRITGLADGTYTIYAFFWEQIESTTQNWGITAGLTSGSLTTYSAPLPGHSRPNTNTDDVTNAADLTFTTALKVKQVDDGSGGFRQNLFGAKLGEVTVSGGSAVDVFINNGLAGTGGWRVAYDGIGYELVVPAEPFQLTITTSPGNPETYDFSWSSQPGKVYDLVTSTDLATPITEWPNYDDGVTLHEAIPATGTATTLTEVPSADPRRFFAMREYDAPPLLFANFEDNDGGFTTTAAAGTAWEWGTPASSGLGGTVDRGNGAEMEGTGKAWGTNTGTPGFYANPTTDSRLISPPIDLEFAAAAELSFAQAIDFALGDSALVRLFHADTDEEIPFGVFPLTVTDDNPNSAAWQSGGPYALPVGAPIRIVWSFTGTGGGTNDYMGWYVDDVTVIETPAPF